MGDHIDVAAPSVKPSAFELNWRAGFLDWGMSTQAIPYPARLDMGYDPAASRGSDRQYPIP
jgi:hypothetical protein